MFPQEQTAVAEISQQFNKHQVIAVSRMKCSVSKQIQ